MTEPRQKISGSLCYADGAKDFALIHSVISTARKQRWDILVTLTGDPTQLITELQFG